MRHNSTPHEMFTGRAAKVEDCHPIGELCYAYIRKEQRKVKYNPKARKCLFLCEDYERKAYLVMDVVTRSVISTRDLRFPRVGATLISPAITSPLSGSISLETDDQLAGSSNSDHEAVSAHRAPASKGIGSTDDDSDTQILSAVQPRCRHDLTITELADVLARNYPSSCVSPTTGSTTPVLTLNEDLMNLESPFLEDDENVSLGDMMNSESPASQDGEQVPASDQIGISVVPELLPSPDLSASSVAREESIVLSEPSAAQSQMQESQSSGRKARRKNSRYFNSDFSTYTATTSTSEIITPSSYYQAMKSSQRSSWQSAIDVELESLRRQATWDLVPRTSDMFVIQSRWVFKIKTNEEGQISRFKARLVARGFTQTEGVDYDETYSPVLQSSSRRIIFSLSACPGMKSVQADVETAFLQSEMDKVIYLEPPPGLTVPCGHVLLLRKAIYGLKQSPLLWFCTARRFFLDIGFHQCISDPCLFLLKNSLGELLLSIYVDDISLTSKSGELLEWVLSQAKARFPLRDIKPLSWLVGIRIQIDRDIVKISQSAYIDHLLERFLPDRRQKSATPMVTNLLSLENVTSDNSNLCEKKLYQSIVGSLNYMAHTSRPDIMFSVNTLSRFLISPREVHLQAARRVLRYLNATQNMHLTYGNVEIDEGKGKPCLYAYCDSSFPSKDTPDGRPTSGYLIFYKGNLLWWKSCRETIVCLSTMEAELLAMTAAVTALQHVQGTLAELGYKERQLLIYTDSAPAIKYLEAEMYSSNSRTRHLALRYHFLRQLLREGALLLEHVSTRDQLADVLTKPLAKPAFEAIRSKVLGSDPV